MWRIKYSRRANSRACNSTFSPARGHFAGEEVHLQIAGAQAAWLGGLGGAADERLHAGGQFGEGEGLGRGEKLLAEEALASQRKYLLSDKKHLVKQILQEPKSFDASKYAGQFQYIFIDANHEVGYLHKDTENALKMFSSMRGCIMWHDYGSGECPELSKYLEDLSNTMTLYHIEETSLVVHLQDLQIAPKGGYRHEVGTS